MKAFEIYSNGQYVLTAGIGQAISVVHSILEIHGGILNHIIRGQDVVARKYFDWSAPQPKVGDEITIKIIETDHVSRENFRYPFKQPKE